MELTAAMLGLSLGSGVLGYINELTGAGLGLDAGSGQDEYVLSVGGTGLGRGVAGVGFSVVHEQQAAGAGLLVADGDGLVIVLGTAATNGRLFASGVAEQTGIVQAVAAMAGLLWASSNLVLVNELLGSGLGRGVGNGQAINVIAPSGNNTTALFADGNGLNIVITAGAGGGHLFAYGLAEQTGVIEAIAAMMGLSWTDGSLVLVNELTASSLGRGATVGQAVHIIFHAAHSAASLFADGNGFNIVGPIGTGMGRLVANGLATQSGVLSLSAATMGRLFGGGQPDQIVLPTADQMALFAGGGQLTQVHESQASALSLVMADGQGNNIVMSQAELIGLLMTTAVILGDGAAEVLFKGMWRGMARAMR